MHSRLARYRAFEQMSFAMSFQSLVVLLDRTVKHSEPCLLHRLRDHLAPIQHTERALTPSSLKNLVNSLGSSSSIGHLVKARDGDDVVCGLDWLVVLPQTLNHLFCSHRVCEVRPIFDLAAPCRSSQAGHPEHTAKDVPSLCHPYSSPSPQGWPHLRLRSRRR